MEKKQKKTKTLIHLETKILTRRVSSLESNAKNLNQKAFNFAPGDHWEDHQQETPPSNRRPVVSQQLFFCYPVVRPSQGATVDGNQKSQGPHRVDV